MPNVTPVTPVNTGIASPNVYPQWGIGGGTPGSSAGWKVVEARNESQKLTYSEQGYLTWYSSDAAAKNAIASEESPYQSGEPQNAIPGLAQIGDFFGSLTQGSTWVRVGQVVLGVILIAVGVARITHAVPAATRIAKTAGAVSLA